MIAAIVFILALVAYVVWLELDRRAQREAFAEERRQWARERRELNNRLQAPEVAPLLEAPDAGDDLEGDEEEPAADLPYVRFDDDEDFHDAEGIHEFDRPEGIED